MVYMAGDNGKIFDGKKLWFSLEDAGWRNIYDMSKVGSTSDVAIVAQYDTLHQQHFTPRLFIERGLQAGRVVGRIPPVNTGDPRSLSEFVMWAADEYPAERYALILWGHGTGWREDDIFARYRQSVERAIRGGEVRAGERGARMLERAMFLDTAGEIMSIQDDDVRGICYDDTSMDFLDNHKLVAALEQACGHLGRRLSLLGMDACLMSTVEVAYEIRDCGEYLVASQEEEKAFGWPYASILEDLVRQPDMPPHELSKMIVRHFGAHYLGTARNGGGTNTLSAIDLALISETFRKMEAFSGLLADSYASDFHTELALLRARARAQAFTDQDCLDLRHFLELLRDEYGGSLQVSQLADDLVQHLQPVVLGGPIVTTFCGSERLNREWTIDLFPVSRLFAVLRAAIILSVGLEPSHCRG